MAETQLKHNKSRGEGQYDMFSCFSDVREYMVTGFVPGDGEIQGV
jgi:hypothetical protein